MEEYGQLKWKIIIGKKPRGLWRPPIEIRIWNTETENRLNIVPCLSREFWASLWEEDPENDIFTCRKCGRCEEQFRNILKKLNCPTLFYSHSSHRSANLGNCKFSKLIRELKLFKEHGISTVLYPEWRPGKPDYTDVYEWLRDNICLPVVQEYERRIQEAIESEPTEEIIYTSDDYQVQRIQTEVKEGKKPSRRLRIA